MGLRQGPPLGPYLGTGLRYGPRGVRFFTGEVPLYWSDQQLPSERGTPLRFKVVLLKRQDPILVLTVLCMQNSLDSGRRLSHLFEG
jgi:hypothetical protein